MIFVLLLEVILQFHDSSEFCFQLFDSLLVFTVQNLELADVLVGAYVLRRGLGFWVLRWVWFLD